MNKNLIGKIRREIANGGFHGVWYLAQMLQATREDYETVTFTVNPDDTNLLYAYWFLSGERSRLDEHMQDVCVHLIRDGEIDGIEFPFCPSLDEFEEFENMPTYVGSRYSKA